MGRFHDWMDEDLRSRGYSASTRECYLRCVRHFVRHFMRPPDQLTPEHSGLLSRLDRSRKFGAQLEWSALL